MAHLVLILFYLIYPQSNITMNSISDGAQLKSLAEKCDNHEKELVDISTSMNSEFNHLTQNLNTQIKIIDNDISVINKFFYNMLIALCTF